MPRPALGPHRRHLRPAHPRRLAAAFAAGLAAALLAGGCSGDAQSRLAEVRDLQQQGRFEESIEVLRDALELDPELAEAHYRLGLALVQTGEPSRALWPLQQAAASSDYAISAGVLLASTLFQTRNFDEAVRRADRVLEIDPERQAALRIRANANLAARRLEAALSDTERLVKLHPTDYGVRALHATVLADLGREEEAEREHDLLKRMGAESGDRAFAARACLAPATFAEGTLGEIEKATALYEECAALEPTESVVIGHMAAFFQRHGDPERAIELWRTALRREPGSLGLHQGLAAQLRAVGREEEAERTLREAVESIGSPEAWSSLASFYRARLEPEKALAALEKVLKLTGGPDQQVRFALADVLIDLGRLDRAREVTDEISQPTYQQLLRGRMHLVEGDPRAALDSFEKGIRAWPSNAGARFLAGIAARDLGDYDRAVSEFREAVRANNSETDAALLLARIYLERGRYRDAVTFANLALRGRGGPQQAEPYAIAARALTGLGRTDAAVKSIEQLEERGFSSEAVRERMVFERQRSDAQRALAVAEESGLDLADVANLEVLRQVVEIELGAVRAESAIARVDRALERSPDAPRLLELRGVALSAAGRAEEARAAFERALERDPDSAHAHAGLASLRAQAGDVAEAITLFDKAYALAPEEGAFAYSSAQLVLDSGDTQAATERLQHIIRHHPGVAGARNDMAWILAERGDDLDRALELADEARRADRSPSVLDTAGWVHYRRGEYDQAVMMLEIAVASAPEDASMRYRLGLALEKAGKPDRARRMLETAVGSGSFPEAEEARRHLERLAGS